VHPIERLRSIARADGIQQRELAREAAGALAQLADEPGQLLTACRRIVALQPSAATLWWLGARVLTAADPRGEVWRAADALGSDGTDRELAHAVADDATLMTVGLGPTIERLAARRGDLRILSVQVTADEGGWLRSLGRQLEADAGVADSDDEVVVSLPGAALGSAAGVADLVLVEVTAAGPHQVLVPVGSLAAVAVARQAGVPVWAVAPLGTVLPDAMWSALRERIVDEQPWVRGTEILDAALLDQVVRPTGARPAGPALATADCGVVPDLLVAGDVA
jgi:hypothetical protein